MNTAEKFVADLCGTSFLSLWAYPNPRGKHGKELCDCLVVCDPHVIIFSVKEIKASETGDATVDQDRWHRKAVEQSTKQIYGAERWLERASHVIGTDGSAQLLLPDSTQRCVHRVAVALGRGHKMPLSWGEFGRGYVHVFDEISFDIVLNELDTITDFVRYLMAKESLARRNVALFLEGGGEEDLLAFYLDNDRCFPAGPDLLVVGSDLWSSLSNDPAFKAKKRHNKPSYLWDQVIEMLHNDFREGCLVDGGSLHEVEQALRVMAKEPRYARRVLSKSLLEFVHFDRQRKARSRLMRSPEGTPYVFLACSKKLTKGQRQSELSLRCFVARGTYPDQKTVVGIACQRPALKPGSSFEVVHLRLDEWTQAHQGIMQRIRQDLGYFMRPSLRHVREDEYPLDPNEHDS